MHALVPTKVSSVCDDKMDLEYTLIDCATGLIYGPYETCRQARECAEGFERWGNHQSRGQSCRMEPHTRDRPDCNAAGGVRTSPPLDVTDLSSASPAWLTSCARSTDAETRGSVPPSMVACGSRQANPRIRPARGTNSVDRASTNRFSRTAARRDDTVFCGEQRHNRTDPLREFGRRTGNPLRAGKGD